MKSPNKSQKLFPWKCRKCQEKKVNLRSIPSYYAEVRWEGQLYKFEVKDLMIPICSNCHTKVFTRNVDDQINSAFDRLNSTHKE